MDWEGEIMSIVMKNEDQQERRQNFLVGYDDLWQGLTLAQKFSVSSLTQFGFELDCIRDLHDSHIAILRCNENIAVISKVGEINTQPDINIRL